MSEAIKNQMEIKLIPHVKVWVMRLNPMVGGLEEAVTAAFASSEEVLMEWYGEQLLDTPYMDKGINSYGEETIFTKYHKKDGPLEWLNPLSQICGLNVHGIFSVWVKQDAFMEDIRTRTNWLG